MYSAIALSLAALAAAAPLSPSVPSTSGGSQGHNSGSGNGNGRGQQGTRYVANYDDIEAGLLADVAVIDASDITMYQGLDYEGFTVIAPIEGVGISPESDPNVIAYGGALETLLETLGLADSNGPLITTQYAGSTGTTFDFKSFYFGCQTGIGAAGVPQSCVVTANGYRNGDLVAEQDFDYNAPIISVTDEMQRARLNSDFTNIDTVRFTTTPSGLAVALAVATLLDNLEYVVYPARDNYNNGYGNNGGYGNKGGEQQYGSQGAAKNGTSHGW